MAYGKSKDFSKRPQSDKFLRDKAFKIGSDPKYDGYQRGLVAMVYKFFDKKSASPNKSSGSDVATEPNYQLANELHKLIIKKFKRQKIYSSFDKDDILRVDLAYMKSISKYIKEIKYLLCAIELFCKYAWVVPLREKRGISIVNAFQKIISKGGEVESKGRQKPNKTWLDQDGEFYNKFIERFLKISSISIKMYST